MTRRYVRTPTVFQMEATECGAASLSMILGYYGRFLPLERLRIETGVSRDGCNARNILRAARQFGLEAHGYRMELDDLAALQPPCIIHWEFNHFVVYEGMKGRYAYINDPAVGRRRITREEMDKAFTGIVLTFSPTAEFVRSHEGRSLPSLIRRRLKGQARNIAALILLGLFLILPGLFVPIFSQIFVDQILLGGNDGWMTQLLVVMVLTALFHAGIYRYRAFILGIARKKHVLLSAERFVHHLLRLPMNFYDQRYSGDLANRIENNNSVSMFLIGDLGGALLNICVAVFYLVLLVLYSPVLTLIGVISTVLNLILVRITARTMEAPSIRLQQAQNKLVGALYSGLSITSTLKAAGAENAYVGRVLGNYASVAEDEQVLGKRQEMLNAVPSITREITSVLILIVGALMVVQGSLTPGMLTAYVSLLASFTDPVDALAGFTQQIQTLKANMLYAEDIMSYPEEERFQMEPDTSITGRLSGEVEVDDISYGYSRLEEPLVQDFRLHVGSGESVALVGDSGCGKSTVARIISGLYQPWSGEIRMDGVPMNRIPREILATSVATVSQDIMLFSGSIRDNLTLWNNEIPEEDIMQAAKDACIHEVIIGRPGGYAHQLTEGGTNLSGGERQRLEIARALVTNPSILIMDEATSALDPIVEKEILDNIQRRGCTCIVVAHRLSAIRDCNEILVMRGGRVLQRGTHEELAGIDGPYRDLVQNN